MNKNYYQRQLSESDVISKDKLEEKKKELEKIFLNTPFRKKDLISVAILGCGDKRHLEGNKKIFEGVLDVSVDLTTFDLEVDHLDGRAIKHDCTLPLPGKYDITYAHVLLKFIYPKKQLDLIQNSFDALNEGGLAIHVLDKGDKEVEIDSILKYLKEKDIKYNQISLRYGFALVLMR